METSEYDTNTLLINNISSIVFRVYEPSPDQSQTFHSLAPDVEGILRNGGYIIYYESIRRALWHFQIPGKDEATTGQAGSGSLGNSIDVSGVSLSLIEEGAFEPISLFRSRFQGPHSANTPTSSSSSGSALDLSLRNQSSFSASSLSIPSSSDPDSKAVTVLASETKGPGSVTLKEAYEHFITAVLSTISASFCKRVAALPLNYRTVLLPLRVVQGDRADRSPSVDSAMIGTFRIYLTTTGALVVSLALTSSDGLISVNDPPNSSQVSLGTQVLTAPFGVLANYQGLVVGNMSALDSGVGQTPETQVWRFRSDADAKSSKWRETCIKMLHLRGIPHATLQSCPWLVLQLFRRKQNDHKVEGKGTSFISTSTTISWPSVLCFRKKCVTLAPTNHLGDAILLSQDETSDSLSDAKVWFQSGSERDEKLIKRRKERELAAIRDAQGNIPPQQTNGHSPLGLRRASNAAAAGAMYPTPPDGIQNPVGVTPSIDGTTSSPGNQAATMAVADIDTTMTNSGVVADSYGDSWGPPEPKRERGDSFLGGDDGLYDDMGGDMFGDTDITDADFSFFDEQPGDDDIDLPGMSDLVGPDHSMPISAPPNISAEPASQKVPEPIIEDIKFEPSPPMFAKPELKHARSTLTEDGKPRSNFEKPAGIKREPSPFDPDTVYKRVRASLVQASSTQGNTPRKPTRKGSIFDKVDFDPVLPLVNKKYEEGGRFDCHWAPQAASFNSTPGMPPTTDYLRRHGKHKKSLKELPDHTSALIRTITGSLENSSLHASPGILEDLPSDADDVSLVSDQDDSSVTTEEPASPFKSSVMRLNLDDEIASHATSLRDIESVEEIDPNLALDLPRLAKVEAVEVAITKYFEDPESLPIQISLPDEDIMTVAQILTEQAVTGNLKIQSSEAITLNPTVTPDTRRQLASVSRGSLQALREIIPACLGEAMESQFRAVIEVPDVPLLGQPSRLPPRPVSNRDPNSDPPKPSNLYQIPAPHLELRRAEAKLSVLPSSVAFWESLGLGPSRGPKDINAVCVFPDWEGMSDNAGAFLDRMRNVYELLKMGTFERIPTLAKFKDGLVPFEADKIATSPGTINPRIASTLGDRMELLSHCLSSLTVSEKNFVVYFVYPPDHPGSIIEACSAFQGLFEMHKRTLLDKRKTPANELVLQLIPLDFSTSSSGMVFPPPNDFIKLALETYDRCTMFDGPMPAPAIILEQALPRAIEFKLANTASSSLMHENSCIHIAYAQSIDERWITAAWSDNKGSQQMTASYCLGRKGKPLAMPVADVAHEIWETTHDLISRWKVHWRIVITKCGPMDQQEIEFWVALAQTESKASVSLTLLTVDTNPSLQLIPPAVKIPAASSATFYTTPVSTPQPSTLSPEQSGTPATPVRDSNPANASTPGATPGGGDNSSDAAEGDAILVDVTDQTWGAILAHRLSNSSSLTELNPSLISGYLVKRGGTKLEDPPVMLEVNIVHSDGNPRAYEPLLREMLSYFRGLGTLARARGVVDRETDIRPWHIAAAEKGVRALYLLM